MRDRCLLGLPRVAFSAEHNAFWKRTTPQQGPRKTSWRGKICRLREPGGRQQGIPAREDIPAQLKSEPVAASRASAGTEQRCFRTEGAAGGRPTGNPDVNIWVCLPLDLDATVALCLEAVDIPSTLSQGCQSCRNPSWLKLSWLLYFEMCANFSSCPRCTVYSCAMSVLCSYPVLRRPADICIWAFARRTS